MAFSSFWFRRIGHQSKQLPHWGTREQGGQVLRLLESHLAVLPGLPRRLVTPEHRNLQLVCVCQRQQHLCTDKARDRLLALLQHATLEESRQQLSRCPGMLLAVRVDRTQVLGCSFMAIDQG